MENTKDLLSRAKSAANRAHEALSDHIIATLKGDTRVCVNGYLSGPVDDIRYSHPSAANYKSSKRLIDAVLALALGDGKLEFLLGAREASHAALVTASAAEKARLNEKRAAVKAKAAQRTDLNLQEGVKLAGVDVGQYTTILAGLEEVRAYVEEVHTSNMRDEFAEIVAALDICGYLVSAYNPKPVGYYNWSKARRAVIVAKDEALHRYFNVRSDMITPKDNVAGLIVAIAKKRALAYVQGYAVKLAGKVGDYIANELHLHKNVAVVSASVSSPNLWSTSVCRVTVRFESGVTEVIKFHTQMILNTSCLGKLFNQWPTRLVA